MRHVAIMRKSWGFTQKIATGQKTIESRWYMHRSVPWGKIIPGDIVYFKDSGEPVTLRAIAADVLQFDNLTPARVNALLQQYGNQHGLTSADIPHYYELFKNKRYCMLIFLKGVEAVTPFHINKRGYGAMAAWLMTSDINKIKRTSSR